MEGGARSCPRLIGYRRSWSFMAWTVVLLCIGAALRAESQAVVDSELERNHGDLADQARLARVRALAPGSAGDAAILMDFLHAISNANEVSELSTWNYPASVPCYAVPNSKEPYNSTWYGVMCNSQGSVISLQLMDMGLEGTLPLTLASLNDLVALNVGSNRFSGTLPTVWTSSSVEILDVSDNALSGTLPAEWGTTGGFPNMRLLRVDGNEFVGSIPDPQWTQSAFGTTLTEVIVYPGNSLCGGVLAPQPQLMGLDALPQPVVTVGAQSNTTSTLLYWLAPFSDATESSDASMITNTLGSCFAACTDSSGQQETVEVTTNLFDLAWTYEVGVADLVSLNPATPNFPGARMLLPCYAAHVTGARAGSIAASGSDLAYGQTGAGLGRILSPIEEFNAAGAVLSVPPAASVWDPATALSTPAFTGVSAVRNGEPIQPAYWVVDLHAELNITLLAITSGGGMAGVDVYVGSDGLNLTANALVAQGLSFSGQERRLVAVQGTSHALGRFVVLLPSGAGGAAPSLDLAQVAVFASESNAAAGKALLASQNGGAGGAGGVAVVPSDPSICVEVQPGVDGVTWLTVDLGYVALVDTIAAYVQSVSDPDAPVTVYVTNATNVDFYSLQADAACGGGALELSPGQYGGIQCGIVGRYASVVVPNQNTMSLCDLEVFLASAPLSLPDVEDEKYSLAPIVVPAVLAPLLLLLVIAGLLAWKRPGSFAARCFAALGALCGCGAGCVAARREGSQDEAWDGIKARSEGEPDVVVMGGAPGAAKTLNSSTHSASGGAGEAFALVGQPSVDAATDLTKIPERWNAVDVADLELVRRIGDGSFGAVWLARFCQTTVAVKLLNERAGEGERAATLVLLQQEAAIMSRLRHPNCCQYLGVCLNPPGLIMEYCSRRSVDALLAAGAADPRVGRTLSWLRLLSMALDAARGMLYLHSRSPPIVHRDLKSANLLVDGQWHVKVADFNLSRALEPDNMLSTLCVTNPRWLAPELLGGGCASLASDVWAFGTVLWELMTWSLPFPTSNPFQIISAVLRDGASLPIPPPAELRPGPLAVYDSYVALMNRCWATDPSQRPSMSAVATDLRSMLAAELDAAQSAGGGAGGGSVPLAKVPRSRSVSSITRRLVASSASSADQGAPEADGADAGSQAEAGRGSNSAPADPSKASDSSAPDPSAPYPSAPDFSAPSFSTQAARGPRRLASDASAEASSDPSSAGFPPLPPPRPSASARVSWSADASVILGEEAGPGPLSLGASGAAAPASSGFASSGFASSGFASSGGGSSGMVRLGSAPSRGRTSGGGQASSPLSARPPRGVRREGAAQASPFGGGGGQASPFGNVGGQASPFGNVGGQALPFGGARVQVSPFGGGETPSAVVSSAAPLRSEQGAPAPSATTRGADGSPTLQGAHVSFFARNEAISVPSPFGERPADAPGGGDPREL